MTELEQRLINDLSRLAEQYEREQTQLAAQVETLTENMVQLGGHVTVLHVRGLEQRVSGLAEQYEQEQMRLSEQVKSLSEHVRGFTSELREDLTQYQTWANSLAEQQHLFDGHVNTESLTTPLPSAYIIASNNCAVA